MKIESVLLIEDNAEDAQMTREALERYGCTVEIVDDGEVAVERVKAMKASDVLPGLILVDLYLPKRTGIEVLDAIQANPALERVPVLVQTSSSATEHYLRQHTTARVDGCVHKPVEWDACAKFVEEKKAERSGVPLPF